MSNTYNPVIVVVAFNRIKSLQRILNSLAKSIFPVKTKLIISIDNNGQNKQVADFARQFEWKNGDKEVIYQDEHLGLRKHVLRCGDISFEYGSIIMLEDDLVVSPYFYTYAIEALNYYETSEKIGGISLYNLPYTEALKQPFIPILDDSDVYFKQIPSSLGQTWTVKQWDSFRKWYDADPDIKAIKGLPVRVRNNWPESSWKKYFYGYLVEKNKYFVFPQISYTSNFNDLGENMKFMNYFGQVRLAIVESSFKFKTIENAINVYDAHSELLVDRLKKLQPNLSKYDFESDLYDKKESFSTELVLTSKKCKNSLLSFSRAMKPMEMNIIYDIPGNDISLAKREDVILDSLTMDDFENEYAYFYRNILDTNILFKVIINRIRRRIKSIFGRK